MSRLLIVLAVLGFGSFASGQDDPNRLLQQGVAAHRAGKMEEAVQNYRAYLKLRPDAQNVRSDLGAALSATGRYGEAITEYRLALKQGPKDPRIWLNLALAYYKSGQFAEAARELAGLHVAQPGNPQVSLLLADCWLRQGEYAKVVDLLTPLENDTDLAVTYLLGTALLRNKQVDKGQKMIDRILRNGDSAEARLLLGTAKLEALDYPAAIADLQKAVELDPQLPDGYSYLGLAQMLSGNMPAARASFEKELERNPNDYESNLRLAVLLKQDGDYGRARELLTRALRVRPGDLRALYQVGAVELAAGNMEKACVTLEQVIKRAPNFLEGHVSLAQVYYRMRRKAEGDRERAIVAKLKAAQDANEGRGKVE
ncbi:MAG: tetratricopeptide repeat protein [Bryobacteraceae bacterium]